MEVKCTKKKKTLILTVTGEIDHHTSKEIRERADRMLIQMGGSNLIFNLQKVTFMDSSGIGMMIGRYKHTKSLGGRIAVLCSNEKIKEIIELSGLSSILKSFETLEDALLYTEGREE